MDKDVENLSSSMKALTEQIKENNAALLISKKTTSEQSKEIEDILKNSLDIENSYKRQSRSANDLKSSLKDIKDNLVKTLDSSVKVGNVLTSIGTTAFAANIVKDMIDLDNKMTALSVRMGKGKKGINELKKSVNGLQKEFGTSYENAVNLTSALAKEKYVGNIKEAAAGIDLFSRASGVSNPEILELTNNLSKMGDLSTKSINAIYAGMIKVQQQEGISEKGMTALVSTINDMTMDMVAFGKSSDDIKRMAGQTTALVGAMEQVGISAQRSTALVKQLTDPDEIENNIMLYSQLGISMEEAMSGSIDTGKLGSQFKEMSERIVEMGPIAGSAFAKSMGMSYKEATRMAKMEAEDIEKIGEDAVTPEDQALDAIKKMEAATEGIGKTFETNFNKLEGDIKDMPKQLLIGIALIAPILINKGKKILKKIFSRKEIQASIDTAVGPSMENSFKKSSDKIEKQSHKLINKIKGNADKISPEDKKLEKAFNKAYKKTSKLNKIYEATNKNFSDGIQAQLVNTSTQLEQLTSKFSDANIDINKYLNSDGSLNKDLIGNVTGNKKESKSIDLMVTKYNKLAKAQKILDNEKIKSLGIQGEDIKKYKEASKNLEKAKAKKEEITVAESNMNEALKKRMDIEKKRNSIQAEANKRTTKKEDREAMKKTVDLLSKSLDEQNKILKENVDLVSKKGQVDLDIENSQGTLNDLTEAAEKKSNEPKSNSAMKKEIRAKKRQARWENTSIGSAIKDASYDDDGNEIELSKKQKFGIGAKAAGKSALGGIKKMLGGIFKTLGPMALIASIGGKLLSKIQGPLEDALNVVADKLSPIIIEMLPAIEALVNVITNYVLPPILNVLSGIMKAIHWITKPLVAILKALENIPLIGKPLAGIGDALDKATSSKVTDGLDKAAKELSTEHIAIKDASDQISTTIEDTAKDENAPGRIEARGASMVANGTTQSSSYTGSSGKSSEDALREEEDRTINKNNSENVENINNNTNFLPKILRAIERLLEILTNKDININEVSPGKAFLTEPPIE